MKTVTPDMIPAIDRYAAEVCGIPTEELMRRAGEAVAAEIAARYPAGRAVILCGGGNNGGDGYAAALALATRGYRPVLVDLLGKGQRSAEGKAFLAACHAAFGEIGGEEALASLQPDLVVDAVFGTGFQGTLPPPACRAAEWINGLSCPKVAVDVPLGVNAADGSTEKEAVRADLTVVLSFMKIGLLSYPARAHTGETVVASLGLEEEKIAAAFPGMGEAADDGYLARRMPRRPADSHKGSFGKALLIAGSAGYRGAALLATEGALRLGAGLVALASEEAVLAAAAVRTPEAVLVSFPPSQEWTREKELPALLSCAQTASAVLVGPGCGRSAGVDLLLRHLLQTTGAPLLLDADALNIMAADRAAFLPLLRGAGRPVLLTPHPLEFSRLSGLDMAQIAASRLATARHFATENGVFLLLKGAGTVLADPDGRVSVNTSGSCALAKGGSGDVLSGMLAALLAMGAEPFDALCLGAYLHGRAGEEAEKLYSAYGVLPGELPLFAARLLAEIKGY